MRGRHSVLREALKFVKPFGTKGYSANQKADNFGAKKDGWWSISGSNR